MAKSQIALAARGISKSFGARRAVDDVSLEVLKGTVHAVLGENGAGKTTLMRIFGGILRPDSGSVEVEGRTVFLKNPRAARRLGIGMVHQHLALLPALTVGENLLLDDDAAGALFHPSRYGQSLSQHAARFSLTVGADKPVWQLTTSERQILEVCRVLMHDCSILILDEPTAHLSPIEGDQLLGQVKQLATEGATVLLVTHKLREIEAFADAVTVLRDGRHVLTGRLGDVGADRLARAMMGEDIPNNRSTAPSRGHLEGETILQAAGLAVRGKHRTILNSGIEFSARRGEIVGIAGISGAGQEELAAVLVGLESPALGTVDFPGRSRPTIAYVPADRASIGAPGELPIDENLTLRDYRDERYAPWGLVDEEGLERLARVRRERYQIRALDPNGRTDSLSGGNIQRVVLARELDRAFDLVVAHNPTAGLDLAGQAFVRERLREAVREGAAVIVISDDIDEILELSDRVLVMARGRCQAVGETALTDRVRLGHLMLSSTAPEALAE